MRGTENVVASDLERRATANRRLVIALGVVVLAIYLGFILMAALK